MNNTVLAETGPLSPTDALTLLHADGTRTETRGKAVRLSQSQAELRSAFATAGHIVWCSTPTNKVEVEHVITGGATYRVIDTQRITTALVSTTRYLLQDDPVA